MGNIDNLFDGRLSNEFYKINTLSHYFYEWKDGAMTKEHAHRSCEIMAILKGQCFIHIGGHRIKFAANSLILINADVPHRLEVQPGQRCLVLNTEFNFAPTPRYGLSVRSLIENSQTAAAFLQNHRDYVVIHDAYGLIPFLRTLVIGMSEKPIDQFMTSQLYFMVIQIIARSAAYLGTTASDTYERQITGYLLEHYAYDVSIKDIAKAVRLDSAYIQRLYKKKTGMTIIEKLTEIRIKRAKDILKDKSISIGEVSGYVGIDTNQYFSTLFKQKTGMTPSQWRKSQHLE